MPDHDALLHTAHLQWGYVTTAQAKANGSSRQLCGHDCRKGAWLHIARSLLDAMSWRRHHDLSDVVERGLRLGRFGIDACLSGIEGLPRVRDTVARAMEEPEGGKEEGADGQREG